MFLDAEILTSSILKSKLFSTQVRLAANQACCVLLNGEKSTIERHQQSNRSMGIADQHARQLIFTSLKCMQELIITISFKVDVHVHKQLVVVVIIIVITRLTSRGGN